MGAVCTAEGQFSGRHKGARDVGTWAIRGGGLSSRIRREGVKAGAVVELGDGGNQ